MQHVEASTDDGYPTLKLPTMWVMTGQWPPGGGSPGCKRDHWRVRGIVVTRGPVSERRLAAVSPSTISSDWAGWSKAILRPTGFSRQDRPIVDAQPELRGCKPGIAAIINSIFLELLPQSSRLATSSWVTNGLDRNRFPENGRTPAQVDRGSPQTVLARHVDAEFDFHLRRRIAAIDACSAAFFPQKPIVFLLRTVQLPRNHHVAVCPWWSAPRVSYTGAEPSTR